MRFPIGGRLSLVALALLGATTLSVENAGAGESATISVGVKANGSGVMIVNSQTNPDSERWSWQACTPDLSRCRQFAAGRIVSTAGGGAHTVFRVTSSRGPTALSPLWRGRVASVKPPSVRGAIRANELVTPLGGKWTGGWEDEDDAFQLSACLTPSGKKCTTLTDPHYPEQCPRTAVVLDPALTGRYLRVADRRIGPGPHFSTQNAVPSPYGREVWRADTVTAVTSVGRIAPPAGPRTVPCGPPPLS